jgi:hypothetical protein
MKVFGIIAISLVAVIVVALVVIGTFGPDTAVYPGRQLPKRFLSTIESLNLIAKDEKIRYFYSDGLIDIKTGMYFVTDRTLVLYSSEWAEPKIIIPLTNITSMEVEYDDSFFGDSMVFVTTRSGEEFTFPVSSEKGLDKKFIQAIQEKASLD